MKFPTLGKSILDLVLCQHKDFIINLQNGDPFCTSDHDSLSFQLLFSQVELPNEQKLDFSNGNYGLIESHLSSINWYECFSNCANVEAFYNKFLTILNHLIYQHVPFRKGPSKFKYPQIIRKLQSKKLLIWKKMKSNPNLKPNYKFISSNVENAISAFYCQKEDNLLKKGSDLKEFFRFFNSKLKVAPRIPDIVLDNQILSDDISRSIAFNNFFGSVFITDDLNIPEFHNIVNNTVISMKFTAEIVLDALNKLKASLSVGPDGLCAFFLKKLKYVLCQPLSIIFEVSYRTGELPSFWKQAIVVPIFKKGLSHCVDNYRPVSLCCVSCKLMESIINAALNTHLDTHNIIKRHQYGFRKNTSCTLQLLNCMNQWTKMIDAKTTLDVVYIDFQKAFDSVVHSKLIVKLEGYGISGFLLNWLRSFLSNRVQSVKINSALSDQISVTSGVPQGSVLGPTLFLLYINDLVNVIEHSEILLFADDLKIFNSSNNNFFLQSDLNNVVSWSKIWQLPISVKKSNILYIGRNNPKFQYFLDGLQLDCV